MDWTVERSGFLTCLLTHLGDGGEEEEEEWREKGEGRGRGDGHTYKHQIYT